MKTASHYFVRLTFDRSTARLNLKIPSFEPEGTRALDKAGDFLMYNTLSRSNSVSESANWPYRSRTRIIH
jgi:hypothetical protein